MRFDGLHLQDWQQLELVELDFSEDLTVITGANGSGKSTILRLLSKHFGWSFQGLRTPRKERGRGAFGYFHDWLPFTESEVQENFVEIGQIRYSDQRTSRVRIPRGNDRPGYQPKIDNPQSVQGVYFPPDRQEFSYQSVSNVPLEPIDGETAYNQVRDSLRRIAKGGNGRPDQNIKESLIRLALFSYRTPAVEPDEESRRVYEGFQQVLKKVLPAEIGFQDLSIRGSKEVVLETQSGDFLLGAVSGGIGSLILIAWTVYLFSLNTDGSYTVIIDEPEVHLHPRMQRSLLNDLIDAFPRASFVVATHSPLVVGSVRGSNVYALRFQESGQVYSHRLDIENKSGSAEEVLHEVLGVPFTRPIWVEKQLEQLQEEYADRTVTPSSMESLRNDLRELGLERWASLIIADVLEDE